MPFSNSSAGFATRLESGDPIEGPGEVDISWAEDGSDGVEIRFEGGFGRLVAFRNDEEVNCADGAGLDGRVETVIVMNFLSHRV